LDFFAGWLVPNLNQILVEWCGLVRGEFGGVRIKNGHNGHSFWWRSMPFSKNGGEWCSILPTGEREGERTLYLNY
jgi:hypothetical protein